MSFYSRSPVHTPDELLSGARRLLDASDPVMFRAAVLEAITALESFVHSRVFTALEERLDPLLVKWLESKTRMDFDSRLGVLTPIATGLPVDRQAELWSRYKRAKELRNAVTHSGRKVSSVEALEVLQTVHDWLSYLASSAEVDAALSAYKRAVEAGDIVVTDEHSASQTIEAFFSSSLPAQAAVEQVTEKGIRADVVLQFGARLVVIEIKFLASRRGWGPITMGVKQLKALMAQANAERGALVVFSHDELQPSESSLTSLDEGSISVVSVKLPYREV